MDHHHEPSGLDEATKTMKKYWFMPRVYNFDTEIREIDRGRIRLRDNYFYPEGGGQPSDRGLLLVEAQKHNVVDVQEEDDIVWIYVDDHDLEEGMELSAKIDQYRRETLTRNHSAQHLLSAIFWDEFEMETSRALIEMKETEIELNQNPSIEQIDDVINLSNEFIEAELKIESEFYSGDDLNEIRIRGGIAGEHNTYRLVKIGTIDLNPCGGTHLEHTGQIDTIAVEKIDGKRLKFLTGQQARNLYTSQLSTTHSVSRTLGVPLNRIEEEVNRLYDDNKSLQKSLQSLQNELLINQLKTKQSRTINSYQLSTVHVKELNRGVILDQFDELNEKEIVVVIDPEGGFVLNTAKESLTSDIMTYLRENSVKGGGRGTTVMGTSPDGNTLVQLLEAFLSSIS